MIAISLGGIYSREPAHDHKDISFVNYVDQDLALNEYARLAQESKGAMKERYLRLFFDAFPRDFPTFFKMTHYSMKKGFEEGFRDNTYYSTTFHSYIYSRNPWSSFHLELQEDCASEKIPIPPISGKFPVYESRDYMYSTGMLLEMRAVIPAEILYDKMLTVGINGFWDADEVSFLQNYIGYLIFDNTPLAIKILNSKSDDQIASFFYFLYDGPHPKNKKENYEYLHKALAQLDPRVAWLLQVAYKKLLSEEHCPGH